MDLQLKNKRVLVLGASSGLGFHVAKAYSDEGACVAICSRDEMRIKKASVGIPGSLPFVCDLDKAGEGKALVERVIEKLGGIDILFVNTGGPQAGPFSELKIEDWQKGFEKLWLSAIECVLAASQPMKEQRWGRIILNTSTAAKEPIQNLTVSTALRSGLLGLVKTMSREFAPYQITANVIMPGYTKTERLAELGVSDEVLAKEIPMGRLGKPEEYAALAVFLGSEPAAYITGQAIACDGGLIRGNP